MSCLKSVRRKYVRRKNVRRKYVRRKNVRRKYVPGPFKSGPQSALFCMRPKAKQTTELLMMLLLLLFV